MSTVTNESDGITQLITDVLDEVEAQTGTRPGVADLQVGVAVNAGVAFPITEDDLYHRVVFITAHPGEDEIRPVLVAVPNELFEDLFTAPVHEEDTNDEVTG